MSDATVLEFPGVVLRELYSGQYCILTDRGEEVLASVRRTAGLSAGVKPGDRVHVALGLEDTAPARILRILEPAHAEGR